MIESIGWYSFLAAVITMASYASKSFLRFVMDKGAEGEQVEVGDTLLFTLTAIYTSISTRKLATACAVGTFLLIGLATQGTFYSALGYAAIVFVLSGYATPALMHEVSPLAASPAAPSIVPIMEQGIDSKPDLC
jgi:hypothetical protein